MLSYQRINLFTSYYYQIESFGNILNDSIFLTDKSLVCSFISRLPEVDLKKAQIQTSFKNFIKIN